MKQRIIPLFRLEQAAVLSAVVAAPAVAQAPQRRARQHALEARLSSARALPACSASFLTTLQPRRLSRRLSLFEEKKEAP